MTYHITNRKKSWFKSPAITILLAILVIVATTSLIRAFIKEREAAKLRNQYRDELTQMNERSSELDTKITTLSTTRGIESEIRERYRVAKQGEELVVVVDNGKATEEKKVSFWTKLRMFLGF